MSIQKYRAFLTAVEEKNLTKAAKILGYTQPGISLMISSLEQDFGFPLLIRTKDGILPTENGQYLQGFMQQIISLENSLVEASYRLKGLEIGELRIGALPSVCSQWLPEIIYRFLLKHPNIDLKIFEGVYGTILEDLSKGKIDVAFVSTPVPENFDFISLWTDPILAVLSRDNPLSQQKKIDLKDLIQFPFLVPNSGGDESVLYVLQSENLTANIRFRIKGDVATIAMIERGLGVSLIPKLAITAHSRNVVTRPLTRNYNRNIGICIRSLKYASPLASAFIQESKDFIASI